jgi:hypothetical protein
MDIRGVLTEWTTTDVHADMRLRGVFHGVNQERFDDGNVIVTRPIVRIYKEHGLIYAETKNSLYILA